MSDHREAVESVVRLEAARIVAALIRTSGSFDRAEDALQEALTAAVAHWGTSGVPRNPGAWVMAVAQRRLVDVARRARTRLDAADALAHELSRVDDPEEEFEVPVTYPDDRLRLIFTCCHPTLNVEARIALTLRTLGRLTTAEIARAFLVPEATLAQRLVRPSTKSGKREFPTKFPHTIGCPSGSSRSSPSFI
jgi:RNA polymerase sigma-70 factor (ECF subfamily)